MFDELVARLGPACTKQEHYWKAIEQGIKIDVTKRNLASVDKYQIPTNISVSIFNIYIIINMYAIFKFYYMITQVSLPGMVNNTGI